MMLSTKEKMRVLRTVSTVVLGARAALARDRRVVVRRRGINWRLDLSEGIDLAIYLGFYQRIPQRVAETWIRPGSVAFDIGANIGAHSFPLALSLPIMPFRNLRPTQP
jgi:hypothetical protein